MTGTDEHLMMGRLCGGFNAEVKSFTTIVVCSCGHSFYGASVDQADNRFRAHAEAGLAR